MKVEETIDSRGLTFHVIKPTALDAKWSIWLSVDGDFPEGGFIVGMGVTRAIAIEDAAKTLNAAVPILKGAI